MRLTAWFLLLLPACQVRPTGNLNLPSAPGPYALLLGTAQDGGLPQLGCTRDCCAPAWDDPSKRRLVTSLLIVDPRSQKRWLIDATPDLPEQVRRAEGHGAPNGAGARPALFDGIFLTHLHMGHYAGLLHLGKEAYASAATPLFASERTGTFLAEQAPWSALVADGRLDLAPLESGVPVPLAEDLRITPLAVPHRDEYSDTFAFRIDGPERSLLFLPDIDKWERWDRPIEAVLAEVDVALLDGTFFDATEVPGRDHREILHPLISKSLQRFAFLPFKERSKVHFIHLNHSNPAASARSLARMRIERTGAKVGAEGQRFEL